MQKIPFSVFSAKCLENPFSSSMQTDDRRKSLFLRRRKTFFSPSFYFYSSSPPSLFLADFSCARDKRLIHQEGYYAHFLAIHFLLFRGFLQLFNMCISYTFPLFFKMKKCILLDMRQLNFPWYDLLFLLLSSNQ